MAGLVYFDTDVFHLVGKAFANQPLSAELRERVVVSPITVLEALSHLTLKKNDEILRQIQAIHSWVNPNKVHLLPFPIVAITRLSWQKKLSQEDFKKQAKKAINICLSTDSAEELQQSAAKLKDALDIMKDAAAQRFTILVKIYRKHPLQAGKVTEIWARTAAQWLEHSKGRPITKINPRMPLA